MDATNNTNDDFEKLRNKIVAYRDNVTKENQRDLCKDIEQILEIVALERELILIVDDIALLILSVAVSTGNFTVEGLIEKAHKFAYKSLVEEGNYLGSDSIEDPLIAYIAPLINRRKDKNKLPLISLPLIISKGSKDSIPPLLSQYNTQIISSLGNQQMLLLLYNINNSSAFQQPPLVWKYINYKFT